MLALIVIFHLKPTTKDTFITLLQETITQIHINEPDTLLYIPHFDKNHSDQIILYELYRDQKAFEYHEARPYIKKFLKERQKYLRNDPEVSFLEPTLTLIPHLSASVL